MQQPHIEFRYYDLPDNEPVLALMGEKWKGYYDYNLPNLHFHNLMEIGYCHYGEGKLIFEKEEYRFGEDMVSAIPVNFPHATDSEKGKIAFWEFLFLDVPGILEEAFPENIKYREYLLECINRKAHFFSTKEHPQIGFYTREIFREMQEKKEFYQEKVKSLAISLLLEIARENKIDGEETKEARQVSAQIREAISYMEKYYEQELKAAQIAKACSMSETHFRRVFDRTMNMSPMEYLNLIRIQKACRIMKRENRSMDEVALKVGYTTQTTFNRNFKKFVGCSPREWKNKEENYEARQTQYHVSALKGW